ncbi:MAG TPA: FHA domain-containing protein [Anaerolineales bacterium]|jgi:pSer/pThr/pTyr-binding forkhead associated (FHA) protein
MAAQYQLVMHSGPTPGKVFPLDVDFITIGRESENTIVINDAEVSRKHTQLILQGGKFIVSDLGSTNGTFVNGQRLTSQHVLQPGEVISLGEQINLLFEAITQVDPNATMVSSGHLSTPMPQPTPAPLPAARPLPQPVPAQPVYAGQVPAGPGPVASGPIKSSNTRILLIIIGVVLLCAICSCVGILWFIDSRNLWCDVFPFLFSGCSG